MISLIYFGTSKSLLMSKSNFFCLNLFLFVRLRKKLHRLFEPKSNSMTDDAHSIALGEKIKMRKEDSDMIFRLVNIYLTLMYFRATIKRNDMLILSMAEKEKATAAGYTTAH